MAGICRSPTSFSSCNLRAQDGGGGALNLFIHLSRICEVAGLGQDPPLYPLLQIHITGPQLLPWRYDMYEGSVDCRPRWFSATTQFLVREKTVSRPRADLLNSRWLCKETRSDLSPIQLGKKPWNVGLEERKSQIIRVHQFEKSRSWHHKQDVQIKDTK